MTSGRWESMPLGILKMSRNGWCALDINVRRVVTTLAEQQKFKCSLCSRASKLIIDHDHEPEEGSGVYYTEFNIRGLVCTRCNWHLMVYERNERGDYLNWENADSYISSTEYEAYDYRYRCRVSPLIEKVLEKRLGSKNYWRRRIILEKFDAWYYDGARSEWRDRWAQRRFWKNATPLEFLKGVSAIAQHVAERIDKDPSYEPPDSVILIIGWTHKLLREAICAAGLPDPALSRLERVA